ncbi:aspartate aminotransferase family protein [Acetobacter sp. AN02]|uniref:aspartate aminotransferase family protein n=1 Tax=Acetobacter sp. AN02 TaxID=2894186 RepID=UPI0024343DC1|nr:aspartate aminotransferase family protein [Acetobacter sp. AN02]MDG6093531.1 aspartate aminotransferase family protein [Acetobacter sp. AN02]
MIPALMPVFNRADLAFARGDGAWLTTTDGRRFLDFAAGIASCSVGHANPHLVAAIAEQAGRVMHVSNLFRIPEAESLAERLVAASFADSVFFCNSGAEANEGLIKAIRRAQAGNGHPERTRILCFDGAFHGRTLATLAATGNPTYLEGFGEVAPGFDHVPFGNMNAVRDAITAETAGILIEPIQGESGIRPADMRFLQELRAVCDEFGLFLGFDEVQTGIGRTGKLFAHEWAGTEPDICSSAKGLGGGFPIGAILAKEEVAKYLTPGSHGSTFGGNPLACAAAGAVLDIILAPGFLEQVRTRAAILDEGLDALLRDFPEVFTERRGLGLLIGMRCAVPAGDVVTALREHGMLAVTAGDNVLRLVPPLTLTEEDCTRALLLLRETARAVPARTPEGAAA